MTKAQTTLPPRRTAAVTVAGVLLVLWAALGFALNAVALLASSEMYGGTREPLYFIPVAIGLALSASFGYAGLATIWRWRGWRIWAGTVSWGIIVMMVLGLFATRAPDTDLALDIAGRLMVVAVAVFVLVAKRRERRTDIGAVFE